MQKYRVGVIGLGAIGKEFLAEMLTHPRFSVTAAWDPSAPACDAARTRNPGLTLAKDAEAIFASPDVDVVYIASPPQTHCAYICAAVQAGKAIYCEKPLGVDLAESRAVAKLVADSGLPNIVNFNHARALSSNFIEDQIAAGAVGKILGMDTSIHVATWPREFQKAATWLARRDQGGFTREMISHWVYLSQRLLGPGKILDKKIRYPADGTSAETWLLAELDFGGVPHIIKAACGGAGPVGTECSVWGEKQSFRLYPGGLLRSAGIEPWRETLADVSDIAREDRKRSLDGVAAHLAGEPAKMASIADALAVQELIEAILR
jgi:1,5-anhydro-D-fructose reductase (1,5-anhydro-D-mannitol-forming)